jgi:hypothetical protein
MAAWRVARSNPEMSDAERRGYDAPYPADKYKAGARMFPELVPTPPDDPTGRPALAEAENNAAAWAVLASFSKPVLMAFSDEDTVMAGGEAIWLERCPGTRHPGVRTLSVSAATAVWLRRGARSVYPSVCVCLRPTVRRPRIMQVVGLHTKVRGVGHFVQDGGAEQLVAAVRALIDATPAAAIGAITVPQEWFSEQAMEHKREVRPNRNGTKDDAPCIP